MLLFPQTCFWVITVSFWKKNASTSLAFSILFFILLFNLIYSLVLAVWNSLCEWCAFIYLWWVQCRFPLEFPWLPQCWKDIIREVKILFKFKRFNFCGICLKSIIDILECFICFDWLTKIFLSWQLNSSFRAFINRLEELLKHRYALISNFCGKL